MATSSTEPPEEDDDYLTMTFDDPAPSTKAETLTQKRKRLAREAETRARTKSKAELAAEEKAKREAALNSSTVDKNSRGFKMMAALGYKQGTALGTTRLPSQDNIEDNRLLEPVGVEMKEGRSGIGADAEKKRKFREELAAAEERIKKRKVEEGDFRERQQREREEKKMEGQLFGAMKVCEGLEEEDDRTNQYGAEHGDKFKRQSRSLKSVNLLWRCLVKQRAVQERDRRMRYDLHQSLSRRPTYDGPDEDTDDKIAMSSKADLEEEDLELDQEDEELEEFESLDVAERLQKVVKYLREQWNYCFWCKYRYPDASMDGCPGSTEEDHD